MAARMSDALPLFGAADTHSAIVWRAGRPISIKALLADARCLAKQLPDATFQLNLCADRYHFLVALAAAALRGQTLLSPPSRAPADLLQLARRQRSLYCLHDNDPACPELPSLRFPALSSNPADGGEPPLIAAQRIIAELYTSGSTGTPSAHPKSWRMLYRGAELTGRRLGLDRLSNASIVCCVPAQHMYGLETSILLPLRWGLAVSAEQPFFAADIAAALNAAPAPRILVATPIHLRCCIAEGAELPDLAFILCATAPLSRALAQKAEQRYHTQVLEIYGATETGAVATRRPACEESWRTLPGVSLQRHKARWRLRAEHLPSAVELHDDIQLESPVCFQLKGRHADLIKIAGKRASLADLNHQLLAIDGVEDGVFFHPDGAGAGVKRLAAFVVAASMDEQQILDALRDKLDPAFLPRPLFKVDKLPRNGAGKLSRQSLLELFQRSERPRQERQACD